MKLENNYYKLLDMRRQDAATVICRIALVSDCDVYRGHFPGEPVCPGVCNMQMIKECMEAIVGKKLRLSSITQCRLTALMTPAQCAEVEVRIDVLSVNEESFVIKASIYDSQRIYMEYKGEMTA